MNTAEHGDKGITSIIKKIVPIAAFAIPFLALYSIYPASFEQTWKGRTYYMFFLWLVLLETILSWEELKSEKWRLKSKKSIILVSALLLPTIYVSGSFALGADAQIVNFAKQNSIIDLANLMPLSIEYLILTVLFTLILSLEYGITVLREYSVSILFLGIVGLIYMTDNLYPYGRFTPFQFIVPTTANLASDVLKMSGQQVLQSWYQGMPTLFVLDAHGRLLTGGFAIAWPCAGVESLLLYSITILLFLKRSIIPLWLKVTYFAAGAVVTYFINILRIVTILQIAMNQGDWQRFHDYYGQLYSIVWITAYPLLIVGSQFLFAQIRSRRAVRDTTLKAGYAKDGSIS